MNLQNALQTFIAESRELLAAMEGALLEIEQTNGYGEPVNAVFRAAHTIKGSAGLFGLDAIVAFTHGTESVLDAVRDGEIRIDDELVVLLLSCCDHLTDCMDRLARDPDAPPAGVGAEGADALLEQLRRYLPTGADAVPAPPPSAAVFAGIIASPSAAPAEAAALEAVALAPGDSEDVNELWHLSLRFGPNVLRDGMDPLAFIHYLGDIGRIVAIATLPDALPDAPEMDPELCYLGFEIAFECDEDKATIEAVFDFVREDSQIRILPPHSRMSEFVKLIHALPQTSARLGEILVACGSVTQRELATALASQAQASEDEDANDDAAQPMSHLGHILVAQEAVAPVVVEAALARQKTAYDKGAGPKEGRPEGRADARSIRVDADRLDQLVDLVGELTIAAASAQLLARRAALNVSSLNSAGSGVNETQAELVETAARVSALVQEVRDSTLQLRMVKIAATFARFQRVVHDVARELDKDILLETSGEETELDKTVIERIGDPLMHLVRNAIDHGIEPAWERQAAGKPARGCVRLNAFHDSSSIVIQVSDDGGGLKRERILAKAIERGLVAPDAALSDGELQELIFEPGFTTAERLTSLSGRGVGMDVVKRNIGALRGSVSIASQEGVGTTVSVRLPLTLAIIDGFLVNVGGGVFVVPLDMIEECVEYQPTPGHDYLNLRGHVLPFLRLRDFFAIEAKPVRRESVVVIRHGSQRAGLVVDALIGEFQTVIKPLSPVFSHLRAISGSTLLGSGEVALILDVPALLARVGGTHHATPRLASSQV